MNPGRSRSIRVIIFLVISPNRLSPSRNFQVPKLSPAHFWSEDLAPKIKSKSQVFVCFRADWIEMGSNLTEGGFKFWQRFYLEMLTGESEEGWREVVTRLDSWFFHTPRHTIFSREGKGLKKLQWSWRLPWWRWWEWKIGTTMMMKMVTPTLRLWEVEKPQLGSEPLFNLISNPDSNIKWWGWLWCGSFLSAIVILKDLVFFSFIWKSHSTTNFDPCGKLRKTSQRSERQV